MNLHVNHHHPQKELLWEALRNALTYGYKDKNVGLVYCVHLEE